MNYRKLFALIALASLTTAFAKVPLLLKNNTNYRLLVTVTPKKETPYSFVLFANEDWFHAADAKATIKTVTYKRYGKILGLGAQEYPISPEELATEVKPKKTNKDFNALGIVINAHWTTFSHKAISINLKYSELCKPHNGIVSARKLKNKNPKVFADPDIIFKVAAGVTQLTTLNPPDRFIILQWARYMLSLPEEYNLHSTAILYRIMQDRYSKSKCGVNHEESDTHLAKKIIEQTLSQLDKLLKELEQKDLKNQLEQGRLKINENFEKLIKMAKKIKQ